MAASGRSAPRSATAFLVEVGDPPSKQAILRSALKLFVERGYEVTSIRDIAEDAGYTNPALFKFFAGKEDLGVYLFEKTYQELMDAFEPWLRDVHPVEQVLAQWAEAYIHLLAERRHAVLYVHDHLALFWPRVARRFGGRSLFSLMRGWIERGRESGALSASMPIEVQIAAVSGLFHQMSKMVQLGEIRARELPGMRDAVTGMLVQILVATPRKDAER